MVQPIRTFQDKRLAYLINLELSYKDMGYTTKVDGFRNVLEIYNKGVELPKVISEAIIEKYTSGGLI